MAKIYAIISRGKDKGKRLEPHRHEGGYYVASSSRFEKDYIKVRSTEELEVLIRAGYGARLKAPDSKNAPSIIVAKNIHIDDAPGECPSLASLLPEIIIATNLDPESVVTRRREQAFLRAYLLAGKSEGSCVICGEEFPSQLLVAAHIKMRSECSDVEKLDFENVAALMCKFGCDALYEGLFIVVNGGKVAENPRKLRSATPHVRAAIASLVGKHVSKWAQSKAYFNWHKEQCSRA